MTYEGADGTHVPESAASRPAFRFNGYGVPVDADQAEPEPAPDEDSPYRYDAYGPQADPYSDGVPYDEPVEPYARDVPREQPADPYVESVPYDEPVDPYVANVPYDDPVDPYVANVPYDDPVDPYAANVPYDEPVVTRSYAEPPTPPEPPPGPAEPPPGPVARPEPAWSPPTPEPEPEPAVAEPEPAAPEPEPVFAARFEPAAEPPQAPTPTPRPARVPAVPDVPDVPDLPAWRAEVPVARFEPEPPRAPEPGPRPIPLARSEPEPEREPRPIPLARFEPEPPRPPEPETRPVPLAPAAYAEPYVHAYVAADAPVESLARPAPVTWASPARRGAPVRARTDEPAVVARTAYRPAPHTTARGADEARERTWALVSHIGGLLTGFLVPLVTFLVYRKRSPFLREHTTEALNFQLMLAIVYVAGGALTVFFFGVFVLAAAWMFAVTFGTLGALAANDGDRFRYPVNLRVIA